MKVSEAILSRRSMRVFTPEPVPEEAVRRILDVAKRAASNTNCQPWHLYVTMGAARERLSAAIFEAIEAKEPPTAEYHIHGHPIPEPYRGRQVTLGKALYGMLGRSFWSWPKSCQAHIPAKRTRSISHPDQEGREGLADGGLGFAGSGMSLSFLIVSIREHDPYRPGPT